MAVAVSLLIMSVLAFSMHFTDAFGVCYRKLGSNLPMEKDVANLYKSSFFKAMRLYDPDLQVLQALQGSPKKLMLDVPNEKLESLASNLTTAMQWVETYVEPFASTIKYIVVGNGIHPTDRLASSVRFAMKNVHRALSFHRLGSFRIRVSTSIDTSLIQNSNPPSNGEFSNTSYIKPIVDFLRYRSPLLVSVYPYFTYVSNKESISLDYALFTSNGTVVTDPNNGMKYKNLFDAMVDSIYAALEKVGAPNTEIVVSETGWPWDGGDAATPDNAETYYRNLVHHLRKGTPLKPYRAIEAYLFEMFDEDMKPGAETKRHFGLFTPDKHFKYGRRHRS